MDILEYRRREYLGDRLLSWILGELIVKDLKDKFHKRALINQIRILCSNKNLSIIAKEMGLQPHPDDMQKATYHGEPKVYANAYEVFVYTLYLNNGMEAATFFVNDTLVKNANLK